MPASLAPYAPLFVLFAAVAGACLVVHFFLGGWQNVARNRTYRQHARVIRHGYNVEALNQLVLEDMERRGEFDREDD